VILHEEAEDGNAMPDLERPVMAVSRAVTNLVKVRKYFHSSHVMYSMAFFTLKSVYQNINFLEGLSLVRLVFFFVCLLDGFMWPHRLFDSFSCNS
jgi:hypothetical protein